MADILLDALNKRDYGTAKKLIQQGKRVHDIEEYALKKALYSYLADYDMMKFLTQNGYNKFFVCYPACQDERGRTWGVLTRAYALGEYRIMELLFAAGFNVMDGCEWYWFESKEEPYPLWKVLFAQKFDKKVIDMMLSYGCPPIEFDNPYYDERVRNYIRSEPQISLKGFSLGPWQNEIPVPERPYIGFFTFRSTRDYLKRKYEREMQKYVEQSEARKKYIESITAEEWKALEEHRQISRLADQALANMVKQK